MNDFKWSLQGSRDVKERMVVSIFGTEKKVTNLKYERKQVL